MGRAAIFKRYIGSTPAPMVIKGVYFAKIKVSQLQNKEKVDGVVIETLPDTTFKVQLENGNEVLAYLAGKMRINYIKVMMGDRVSLELSPDGKRGRIVRRL